MIYYLPSIIIIICKSDCTNKYLKISRFNSFQVCQSTFYFVPFSQYLLILLTIAHRLHNFCSIEWFLYCSVFGFYAFHLNYFSLVYIFIFVSLPFIYGPYYIALYLFLLKMTNFRLRCTLVVYYASRATIRLFNSGYINVLYDKSL